MKRGALVLVVVCLALPGVAFGLPKKPQHQLDAAMYELTHRVPGKWSRYQSTLPTPCDRKNRRWDCTFDFAWWPQETREWIACPIGVWVNARRYGLDEGDVAACGLRSPRSARP